MGKLIKLSFEKPKKKATISKNTKILISSAGISMMMNYALLSYIEHNTEDVIKMSDSIKNFINFILPPSFGSAYVLGLMLILFSFHEEEWMYQRIIYLIPALILPFIILLINLHFFPFPDSSFEKLIKFLQPSMALCLLFTVYEVINFLLYIINHFTTAISDSKDRLTIVIALTGLIISLITAFK